MNSIEWFIHTGGRDRRRDNSRARGERYAQAHARIEHMTDTRHRELLAKFGGQRYEVQIFMLTNDGDLHRVGALESWAMFLSTFRPFYRWRVRVADNGDPMIIITGEKSGWFPEKG